MEMDGEEFLKNKRKKHFIYSVRLRPPTVPLAPAAQRPSRSFPCPGLWGTETESLLQVRADRYVRGPEWLV